MPSLNLPAETLRLCRELDAPHRLVEHLRLVHCVAFHLLGAFEVRLQAWEVFSVLDEMLQSQPPMT
jgi:hypothetical protein